MMSRINHHAFRRLLDLAPGPRGRPGLPAQLQVQRPRFQEPPGARPVAGGVAGLLSRGAGVRGDPGLPADLLRRPDHGVVRRPRRRAWHPRSRCGKLSLHLRPNGDLTPCGFIPLVLGNILRDDLRRSGATRRCSRRCGTKRRGQVLGLRRLRGLSGRVHRPGLRRHRRSQPARSALLGESLRVKKIRGAVAADLGLGLAVGRVPRGAAPTSVAGGGARDRRRDRSEPRSDARGRLSRTGSAALRRTCRGAHGFRGESVSCALAECRCRARRKITWGGIGPEEVWLDLTPGSGVISERSRNLGCAAFLPDGGQPRRRGRARIESALASGVTAVSLPNLPLFGDVLRAAAAATVNIGQLALLAGRIAAALHGRPAVDLRVHHYGLWQALRAAGVHSQGEQSPGAGRQAGNALAYIDPAGLLYPCASLPVPLARVSSGAIAAAWSGPVLARVARRARPNPGRPVPAVPVSRPAGGGAAAGHTISPPIGTPPAPTA